MKDSIKDLKKSMQEISNSSGTTVSIAFNGEEKVIAKPIEEVGAIVTPKPSLKPLHLACSDDELRPNMQLIKIKNNIACATNGYLLVKIDLSVASVFDVEVLKTLEGKYIHKEVWKELHKCESVQFFDDQIDCWNNGIKKTFYYSDHNGEFWDENTIIQSIKESGEEPQRLVTYNPKLITILHKIFNEDKLSFSFSPNNKGTVVFPYNDCGMFAILMPIESNGVNRYFFM